MKLILVLLSALTLCGATDTEKLKRVKRKSAFTNIISNYFTTDPFFTAKQKPRIHIPKKNLNGVSVAPSPPKKMVRAPPYPSNNNVGRQPGKVQSVKQQASASNFLTPRPVPINLGPPVRILPMMNNKPPQAKNRMLTFQKPTSYKSGQTVPQNAKIPAPLLVGGGNQKKNQKKETIRFNQGKTHIKDNHNVPVSTHQYQNKANTNDPQSFSNLISKPEVILHSTNHFAYFLDNFLHYLFRNQQQPNQQLSRILQHSRTFPPKR